LRAAGSGRGAARFERWLLWVRGAALAPTNANTFAAVRPGALVRSSGRKRRHRSRAQPRPAAAGCYRTALGLLRVPGVGALQLRAEDLGVRMAQLVQYVQGALPCFTGRGEV
jgi:hypothetical protein